MFIVELGTLKIMFGVGLGRLEIMFIVGLGSSHSFQAFR